MEIQKVGNSVIMCNFNLHEDGRIAKLTRICWAGDTAYMVEDRGFITYYPTLSDALNFINRSIKMTNDEHYALISALV